ncbi:hypothetical protein N656DRAFT_779105 [Canariomyces notabilis]|uniref:Uncharacterized protein n=1 Tax=Canariomyces notabilis TaxID=2074819 RepID=A0AAN6TFH3_9PEZI|nr:hypothetical protein N656DRAFT_779105 [Canariomyces arenarius]
MASNIGDQKDTTPAFSPRQAPLVLDESSHELGIRNRDDTDFNRTKITQRDLGSLSVIGSLTKVEYGNWAGQEACLLAFRFQFQKGNATAFRFSKADIVIEFQARPPGNPDHDPAVLRYGPKFLRSTGTLEQRGWHYTASLSASAGLAVVEAGPAVEFGRSSFYARQYAAVVESDDWGNRKHRRPNCVKIWMREDDRQEGGIPLELLAAVVVQTDRSFQANVSVRVDSIFNLVAWPWSKDDPLLLEPGVNFGQPLRQGTSNLDFSTITAEEWRQLVTPDLHFR